MPLLVYVCVCRSAAGRSQRRKVEESEEESEAEEEEVVEEKGVTPNNKPRSNMFIT